MSEEEVMEMINYINNMSIKDFNKLTDNVEKEILSKDTYKELKDIENGKESEE